MTITVNAVNDAPVAVADNYTTAEDTALTVAAPGVLGNDTDVEGRTLTAVLVNGPAHGTLTLNADGSFAYTPAANFNGTDSFTYKGSDGSRRFDPGDGDDHVAAVNDAPVAINDSYTTTEDGLLAMAAAGVLANDTDVEHNALTAVLVGGPAHGTFELTADGSFTYAPAANFNGSDSFTYQATDGPAVSNVATVTITVTAVNDAPVATDQAVVTEEDTATAIALSATDVDSSALTYAIGSGPAHGTLTLSANGGFTYTPAANYNGPDSFTYKANDGTVDSNVATVSITVTGVNDAPVAADQAVVTDEDTATAITLSATDVDSSALTYAIGSGPAHGTLSGTAPTLTYTPAANYNGARQLHLQGQRRHGRLERRDGDDHGHAVNDAPVAADDGDDARRHGGHRQRAGQRHGPPGRTLTTVVDDEPAHGTVALSGDRHLHLHAGGELQRHRQLHLQGERRGGRLERRDGVDHGDGGQRRAGGDRPGGDGDREDTATAIDAGTRPTWTAHR